MVYCPYAESGWEELHVSKAYSDAGGDISRLKSEHHCIEPPGRAAGQLCARERDNQGV